MKLFNYTIDVYKTDTAQSIKREKIKNFTLNATKGLIDAELQLELNQAQLLQAEINEEEEEIKRLSDAILFQEKSISNYRTQLTVLNKEEENLNKKKVTLTFYEDNLPIEGDKITINNLTAEFKNKQ